ATVRMPAARARAAPARWAAPRGGLQPCRSQAPDRVTGPLTPLIDPSTTRSPFRRQRVSTTRIARALISVSDKRGLDELARGLERHGVQILSTGGTARALRDAGATVVEVAQYTGAPEILDGRVKT